MKLEDGSIATEDKRSHDAASGDNINLVEKYGPIGSSAVRAVLSVTSRTRGRDAKRDELDRLLAPKHLPE